MSSQVFSMLGLQNLDIGYLFIGLLGLIIILLILIIVLFVQANKLNKKYQGFMRGKNAKSLEENIYALYEDNKYLRKMVDNNRFDIETLYEKHQMAYQKLGLVKYDAFKQMGGKLSFSLALLDEKDNGFIINSVHSSDGCYSYTKRIKNGSSDISLGEEERVALERAIENREVQVTDKKSKRRSKESIAREEEIEEVFSRKEKNKSLDMVSSHNSVNKKSSFVKEDISEKTEKRENLKQREVEGRHSQGYLYKNSEEYEKEEAYLEDRLEDDRKDLYDNIKNNDWKDLYDDMEDNDQEGLYDDIEDDDQEDLYDDIENDDREDLYDDMDGDNQDDLYDDMDEDDWEDSYDNIEDDEEELDNDIEALKERPVRNKKETPRKKKTSSKARIGFFGRNTKKKKRAFEVKKKAKR